MAALKRNGAVTVIIQSAPFTYRHRQRLIDVAMNQRLATIRAFPPAANDATQADPYPHIPKDLTA